MLVFTRFVFAWEGSREALGDPWGIIEGQLGHLRESQVKTFTSQEK